MLWKGHDNDSKQYNQLFQLFESIIVEKYQRKT